MAQFTMVSSTYGAPMGRKTSPLGEAPRTVRVYRVKLDSGGYDDGGAYWGIGAPLYCAECDEGGRQFVRATSRVWAIVLIGIPAENLKKKPSQCEIESAKFGANNLGARMRELGFMGV